MDDAFDELELEEVADGVRMRVRVSPGARRDAILGVHGGRLKMSVSAPPERGRANEAVIEMLARLLEAPRAAVRVLAGHTARDKTLVIEGGVPATIRGRLARSR